MGNVHNQVKESKIKKHDKEAYNNKTLFSKTSQSNGITEFTCSVKSIDSITAIHEIFNNRFLLVICSYSKKKKYRKLLILKVPYYVSNECSCETIYECNVIINSRDRCVIGYGENTFFVCGAPTFCYFFKFDVNMKRIVSSHELSASTKNNFDIWAAFFTRTLAVNNKHLIAVSTVKAVKRFTIYSLVDLQKVFEEDIGNICKGDFRHLCFLCNFEKVAIITSYLEYILFDIASKVFVVKSFEFLFPQRPFYENIYMRIIPIYLKQLMKEVVFVAINDGIVIDVEKENFVEIQSLLPNKNELSFFHQINVCLFNKCIYLFKENDATEERAIYVYNPLEKKFLFKHDNEYVARVNQLAINWVGDSLFYFDVWFSEGTFNSEKMFATDECLSLKDLCRIALLDQYTEEEILCWNLGSKMNGLIFDNV